MQDYSRAEFLQSPDWAKLQESLGHKAFSVGGFFVFKKKMKFGFSQLFVPRLPTSQAVMTEVEQLAKKEGVSFVRYEPALGEDVPAGYVKVEDHDPSRTLVIELKKEISELETELHPKLKYNIGLAQKKGVTFRIAGQDEFDKFWDLISGTYSRKGITTHSYDHYKRILEQNRGAYLAFAEFEGKVIVANLLIAFGDTVTYMHGGSNNEYRALMGPHLLQWASILDSKVKDYKYYDFWGIAPTDDSNHPWAGITRFKKAFGGVEVQYSGTFEKGMSWKYEAYKILAKLRR